MRIRTRIIGSALAVVAAVCAIFLAYILHKESEDARQLLQTRIDRTHERLKEVIPDPLHDGNVEQLNTYLNSVFRSPDLLEISLTGYKGDINLSRKRASPADGGATLAGNVVIVRGSEPLGEVRTVYSTANIERGLVESRNEILLFAAALMLAVGIVIFLVTRGFTRPIERLTAAARDMADGKLHQAVDSRGAQELAILGESFSRMRDTIREKMADLAENNRRLNDEIGQRRAVEEERDRLVSILEATTDIVSMADPQGNILYFNRAGRSLLGIETDTEMAVVIPEVHPQWAADLILDQGVPAAIHEGAWSGETAILGRDGREIPVSQVILSHKDAQGKLLYLSTIMRDISERQDVQRRLKARDQLLRRLSERVPGVIYQYRLSADGHACFPYASEGIRDIYGVTPEEVRDDATPVFARLHPEDADAVAQTIMRSFADLTPWRHEYRVLLPERGERWLRGESVPERLDDGSVLWHGYITDVTDFKHAELMLRIKDSAIAASINGIAFADLTGKLRYVNQAFLRMWGYAGDSEVVGRSAVEFWEDPEAAGRVLGALNEQDGWTGELAGRRRDGSRFVVILSATVIRDVNGQPVQLMGSFIDITERKRAEEALQRLNEELEERVEQRTIELVAARDEAERANQAKSEFLSRMSHELRTPMNAILGFSQLLLSDPEHPLVEIQRDSVQEIQQAGGHLLDLINEVLDLARIESGKFTVSQEPVPLMSLISDCLTLIRPQAEARGIRIVEAGRDCGEHVLADRVRLKQVLLNLLSNAVKYNRAQGTLSLACMRQGDAIQIRISDTGAGLTAEQQARLFVAFERLDADNTAIEGTGIGLALSKRLTELMHGEIGVESTPGAGSTFWVRLPLVDGHAEDSHHPGDAASGNQVGLPSSHIQREILCIEDNPANLRLIERILARRSDIRLLTASAPGLGLELAVAHRPALILLDINLPDMDGYDVMKCLRENPATRDIPVVAISANAMPKDLARGKAAGFTDYLTKPLGVDRLLRVVDDVIGKAVPIVAGMPNQSDLSGGTIR